MIGEVSTRFLRFIAASRHAASAARTWLVSRDEPLMFVPDRVGAVALIGVDPALVGRALQDALRRAIATRGRDSSWNVPAECLKDLGVDSDP
jgi:hypothetical protein